MAAPAIKWSPAGEYKCPPGDNSLYDNTMSLPKSENGDCPRSTENIRQFCSGASGRRTQHVSTLLFMHIAVFIRSLLGISVVYDTTILPSTQLFTDNTGEGNDETRTISPKRIGNELKDFLMVKRPEFQFVQNPFSVSRMAVSPSRRVEPSRRTLTGSLRVPWRRCLICIRRAASDGASMSW